MKEFNINYFVPFWKCLYDRFEFDTKIHLHNRICKNISLIK